MEQKKGTLKTKQKPALFFTMPGVQFAKVPRCFFFHSPYPEGSCQEFLGYILPKKDKVSLPWALMPSAGHTGPCQQRVSPKWRPLLLPFFGQPRL